MTDETRVTTRRTVLKATGASMVAVSASGVAAGPDGLREANVGFETHAGRRMVREAANDVVREFDSIDAMTVRVPTNAILALESAPGVAYVEENGTMHALLQDLPHGVDRIDADIAIESGSSALQDAVSYAYDNGVFLPTAAGNSGPCSDCVGYPAKYSECVAISSTNSSDGLSYFSSTGSEVELAAPGSSIYSTYYGDSYETLSGTSMATPHVAGAAGILMGQLGYSNTGARSRLQNTAEALGLSSNEQGYGLLDVYSAV